LQPAEKLQTFNGSALPPMVLPSVRSGKLFDFRKIKAGAVPTPSLDPFHFSNAKALRRRASLEQQKIAQIQFQKQ